MVFLQPRYMLPPVTKKSSMVKIRKAKESDYPDIFSTMKENMYQLQSELGLEWSNDKLQNHYRKKNNLVIVVNGAFAGFVSYDFDEKGAFIHSLQIIKERQNLFLGYNLFSEIVQETISKKLSLICCCVFENNKAKEMYLRIGFKEIDREKGILKLQLDLNQSGNKVINKLRT